MMVTAERGQVAGAGQAAIIPGDRMVQIAAGGGTATAGGAAAGVARVDQVLELAAGPVPALGLRVVAGAADDGVESDVQAPQEVRGLRVGRAWWSERAGRFAVAGWARRAWRVAIAGWAGTGRAGAWRPLVPTGGAAVGGGGAVGV